MILTFSELGVRWGKKLGENVAESKKCCIFAVSIGASRSVDDIGSHSSMDRIMDSGSIDWGSTPHESTRRGPGSFRRRGLAVAN